MPELSGVERVKGLNMRARSETWRKRQAVQIAAQLPENPADAHAVLDYAKELLDTFLAERAAKTESGTGLGVVVPLNRVGGLG
jgi:hypothetical protein